VTEGVSSVDPVGTAGEPLPEAISPTVRLVDPPIPSPAQSAAVQQVKADLPEAEPVSASLWSPDELTTQPVVISPWTIPAPIGEQVEFSFNLAKINDQGEDADPILHVARDNGLLAVFDGMGGAGGTEYQTPYGPRTGAYLGARAARAAVDRSLLQLLPSADDIEAVSAQLHDTIEAALRARLAELPAQRSMLRSRLLRALPTTMALTAIERTTAEEKLWRCQLWWAGDSRVYLLQPGSGASQLTTDDIRDHGDAMENLRQDSVISNAMSADTTFVLNQRSIELSAPFVLVAATDGCFGYLPSPMHFEWLLLSTMQNSLDAAMWSEQLQAQITTITGDDASMAVLGIGADYRQFQSLFAERAAALETRWVTPLDQLDAEVNDLEQELETLRRHRISQQSELWAAYRPDYEQYLDLQASGKGDS